MSTYTWALLRHAAVGTQVQGVSFGFRGVWTGDQETPVVSDLALPLQHFQFTKRRASTSTLVVTTPLTDTVLDGLLDRPNGRLRVQKLVWFASGGDPVAGGDYANLPGQSMTYDRGAKSGTVTLRGEGMIPRGSGQIVLSNIVNDRSTLESGRWLEIPFGALEAACGDTVSLDGGQTYPYTVEQVSVALNPRRAKYEINIV
jgi:hypothetical protein